MDKGKQKNKIVSDISCITYFEVLKLTSLNFRNQKEPKKEDSFLFGVKGHMELKKTIKKWGKKDGCVQMLQIPTGYSKVIVKQPILVWVRGGSTFTSDFRRYADASLQAAHVW